MFWILLGYVLVAVFSTIWFVTIVSHPDAEMTDM
jgi:hypothetical protein